MKKTHRLIIASIIFQFILFNISSGQEIEWQKALGGSGYDYCLSSSFVQRDGGFVMVGFSNSSDGDVTGNHGNNDLWLVKLDSLGNIEWQKSYGGDSNEIGLSVITTLDGGYAVCGYTESNNFDVSGNHGLYDVWIIKLDSIGNLQWQKCYGGTLNETGVGIKQTSDGGYIASSNTHSNNGDVSGYHGNTDFWVFKIDGVGNLQWQKCLGGSDQELCNSIDTTDDGGYVITGLTSSSDGDVTSIIGSDNYWVVKLDAGGNIVWEKCYGGMSGFDYPHVIKLTSDGGFILNGETISTDGDVTGNHGEFDFWVIKLDRNGNLQWEKCLGGSSYDRGESIMQTNDGGYIASGTSASIDGQVSFNNGGFGDFWMVKLDSSGNVLWDISLGSIGEDISYTVHQLTDFTYAASGNINSGGGDVTNFHGGMTDYWIVKFTFLYNAITGKVFADLNSNGIQDVNEPNLSNRKMTEQNTSRHSYSSVNGSYALSVLDSGSFSVSSEPLNYYNTIPFNYNVHFSGILQTDSLNDFAFQPAGIFNDLCLTITPLGPFRPGFNASYLINYINSGTTIINNCSVILFPDTELTFISAVPAESSVATDSIVWNLGSLTPYQAGNIVVTLRIDSSTAIGAFITTSARIEPVVGDVNSGCNYASREVIVVGSYDPNDILVDEDTLISSQLVNTTYLEYTIRFQNTGNDTAFSVQILNLIDTNKLDPSSIEFVNSSHPVSLNWIPWQNKMRFEFENILLPDSIVNEPLSHGFVTYRIPVKTILAAGDSITNNAAIYFDFNDPVNTNDAITRIILPTGSNQLNGDNGALTVYPNPASDEMTIKIDQLSAHEKAEMKIYDLTGRTVLYKSLTSNNSKLDIANLSTGVYLLKLAGEKKSFRTKFVKQ